MAVRTTGHSCIGCMGSESPYIVFDIDATTELCWHSDNVESIAKRFGFPSLWDMKGRWVKVTANVRLAKRQPLDGTTRRLQVQRMIRLEDQ